MPISSRPLCNPACSPSQTCFPISFHFSSLVDESSVYIRCPAWAWWSKRIWMLNGIISRRPHHLNKDFVRVQVTKLNMFLCLCEIGTIAQPLKKFLSATLEQRVNVASEDLAHVLMIFGRIMLPHFFFTSLCELDLRDSDSDSDSDSVT
jgi:hypothetical protein